ncbi:MAG TPA: HoxN/HupN/NixA family nickel/cobalt transporter [Solirubrobacteraceae bacterium]|nr:HoxN/HupN/NixA family nickel/cobalt transporter [Solirubrobacteraceae bacterium]
MRFGLRHLTGRERLTVSGMAVTILALNALGWGTFAIAVLPQHLHYRGLGVGLGVAVTAWTLGARHAFDADHIAAIDNCTRKLIAEGRRPLAGGFMFALGHSSVVMLAGVGITIAAKLVFTAVVRPNSGWASTGVVAGTIVSASFLWLIAALNVVVLAGIARVFRDMRRGVYDEVELEAQLHARGLMSRFFGRWIRSINRTWQMFPLGCAFGIGFDTASEVVLLAGTAAAATQGLPWYAVLTLPLVFAGGMTLLDSGDGLLMNSAYAWAFSRPVRKLYYNLTMTGLSVAVAFVIGGIEIVGLLCGELHLHGWLSDSIAGIDLNTAGFVIVGVFLAVWLAAIAFWRLARIESRWELATERETR